MSISSSAIVVALSILGVFMSDGSMGQIDWFSPPPNSGGGAVGADGQPGQPSFHPIKCRRRRPLRQVFWALKVTACQVGNKCRTTHRRRELQIAMVGGNNPTDLASGGST
uniref:Secreted protein n=1 Tax=Globodera rostochiensis TaxID=31243 RepID=A0A914H2R2_GLORO